MEPEANDKFDLKKVHDKFVAAVHEEDDVKLDLYLESYYELDKFFTLMGSVFGFVSYDLLAKMAILQEFLNDSETTEPFQSVKKMIEYEKTNNLLHKKGYVSGSRTLLRLHRGLEFIKLFLLKIAQLEDKDGTSGSCRDAYHQTLAKHHTFIIRKSAGLAMYTLPTKEQLLKRVCGDEEAIIEALELLPRTLEATDVIYGRIDSLYTSYDLHNLP